MRQSGVALLLVLWLIALLTALIGAFALSARVEALQGRILGDGARAQQIARAGMEYALLRVADGNPDSHWHPDGRPYRWSFDDAVVEVRIVDESGKVDLNQADAELLAGLMRATGVETPRAEQIAAAIIDWRDPDDLSQPSYGAEDPEYAAAGLGYGAKDAPFDTVAEVEQVLGMDPQIYAQVAPYLTLYAGRARPDPGFAPGPVLSAMGLDEQPLLAQRAATGPAARVVGQGTGTYSVESRARLKTGRVAVLRTVLRAGGGPIPGSTYTALRWEESLVPR